MSRFWAGLVVGFAVLAADPVGAAPSTGDGYDLPDRPASGLGQSGTGVFRPTDGHIFLKYVNANGFADIDITFGIAGDQPIAADWDGNNTDTLGVYRNGVFYLRNSNTTGFADLTIPFGVAGDRAVVGDWNGDGVDTIGLYRDGLFLLSDSNVAPAATYQFALGVAGDVPIAGDWDNLGGDGVGVFRPTDGHIFLKNSLTTGFADVDITYGIASDKPVAGDWDGDGIDTIGVYRDGLFLLRNTNTTGTADLQFALGQTGDVPIAGSWGSASVNVTFSPADASVNLPPNSAVVITFGSAMNPATLNAQGVAGPCTGSIQASADNFANCIGFGPVIITGANTIASLTPTPTLSFGSTYKIRVTTAAQTVGGLPLASSVTQPVGFITRVDGIALDLVISAVYGAGGGVGAAFNADFVELHNTSTTSMSLSGKAIHYGSGTGTTWSSRPLPNTSVPAGGYFLIQMTAGGVNGATLPTADHLANPSLEMGGTSGKVALSNSAATFPPGNCPPAAGAIDFVAYGSTNCSEGSATGSTATPPLSAFTGAARYNAGCTDGNVNSIDLFVSTPMPRNSTSPITACSFALNETGLSAELDFINVQFPQSTTTTPNVATEPIYVRVFEAGVTETAGPPLGLSCQVGYGPINVNPETTPSGYTWFSTSFNVQVGNDDEFSGTLVAPAAGSYKYTSRCTRNGRDWTYGDLNGAGSNSLLTFEISQLGTLTVSS